MKRRILTGLLVIVALAFGIMAQAQDAEKAEEATEKKMEAVGKSDTLVWAESNFHYIGEKKCKMCHKDQFNSWAETPHAKAWEALSEEEQKNEECVACHSTGKDDEGTLFTGVGCEACHGPGSDYKSNKTMKDHAASVAAGLLPVTEQTCVRCHNEASPTFKEFNYEEALKAGVHEHFVKEEK